MLDRSLTPSITVTIGRHTRLYFAFITTAPTELDSPATITLRADTLLELSCYAEDPLKRERSSFERVDGDRLPWPDQDTCWRAVKWADERRDIGSETGRHEH